MCCVLWGEGWGLCENDLVEDLPISNCEKNEGQFP